MIQPGEIQEIMQKVGAASQLNRQQLEALQEDNFRELVTYAIKHAPYYAKIANGRDPNTLTLEDFPPLNKTLVMENFNDIVTDRNIDLKDVISFIDGGEILERFYLDKYMPLRTSGTSGETLIYMTKLYETMHYSAAQQFRNPEKMGRLDYWRFVLGRLTGPWRSAAVVTMKGNISSGYIGAKHMERLSPPGKGATVSRFFNLVDPLEKIIEELNEYKPNSLFAPPTMLHTLANEQLEGRLKIKLNMPINALITGGEPLHPDTIELVKKAWGCRPINNYGATEAGFIARSVYEHCELRHMLDMSIIEVVDENYEPVPKGQRGAKILITNLINFVQPLIRYEVSDIVGFDAEDDGKPFPRLLPVEGRADDHFEVFDNGKKIVLRPEQFFIFNEVNETRQVQVIQLAKDHMEVRYRLFEAFKDRDEKVRGELQQHIKELGLPSDIKWDLIQVDAFERLPNGKFRRFWSKVPKS